MSATVQKLAKMALSETKPRARVFFHYARTELTPPNPAELPEAIKGVIKLVKSAKISRVKNLTVKEACLNTLVGVEVFCWFFVGEVIGRGKLVGYNF